MAWPNKQFGHTCTNSRTVLLCKTLSNLSQTQLKGNLTMKKTIKAEQCSGKATRTVLTMSWYCGRKWAFWVRYVHTQTCYTCTGWISNTPCLLWGVQETITTFLLYHPSIMFALLLSRVVIICVGEHNYRQLALVEPFPYGDKIISIQFQFNFISIQFNPNSTGHAAWWRSVCDTAHALHGPLHYRHGTLSWRKCSRVQNIP